jgi:hypothetical protein
MATLDQRAVKALAKRIARQPGKRIGSLLAKRVKARIPRFSRAYYNVSRGRVVVRVFPRFHAPTLRIEQSEVDEAVAAVAAAVAKERARG